MNEFHQQYLTLPNKDLIRIISNPGNYQPAAVAAATDILSGRIVTDEDHALAREEQEQQDKWLHMRSDFSDKWVIKTRDAIKYIITPSEKFDPRKWILIICLVYAAYYIFELIADINYAIEFASCYTCEFSRVEIAMLFDLLYTPIMIYLLLRKNIFGWGLLIASVVFGLLSLVSYVFTSFAILNQIPMLLFQIALRAAIFLFLLNKEVRNYFRKPAEEKFDDFLDEPSADRIAE